MTETPFDYQLLSIFTAVAEQSSFSKAARKLGIGKGTVSRAIARLEDVVGAELLHRTTHSVALSTAGTALFERTAHHLAALDQAVIKLPERGEEPSGELRLTAPIDFGAIVLPEVLSQFARRYPEIRFDIRLTNARVDLVAEGFDLAIRAAHRLHRRGHGDEAHPRPLGPRLPGTAARPRPGTARPARPCTEPRRHRPRLP